MPNMLVGAGFGVVFLVRDGTKLYRLVRKYGWTQLVKAVGKRRLAAKVITAATLKTTIIVLMVDNAEFLTWIADIDPFGSHAADIVNLQANAIEQGPVKFVSDTLNLLPHAIQHALDIGSSTTWNDSAG